MHLDKGEFCITSVVNFLQFFFFLIRLIFPDGETITEFSAISLKRKDVLNSTFPGGGVMPF